MIATCCILAWQCCCKDLYRASAGQEIVLYRPNDVGDEPDEEDEGDADDAIEDGELEEGGDDDEMPALMDGEVEGEVEGKVDEATEDEGSQVFEGPELPPEMGMDMVMADFDDSQPSSPECIIVSVSSGAGGGEHVIH